MDDTEATLNYMLIKGRNTFSKGVSMKSIPSFHQKMPQCHTVYICMCTTRYQVEGYKEGYKVENMEKKLD